VLIFDKAIAPNAWHGHSIWSLRCWSLKHNTWSLESRCWSMGNMAAGVAMYDHGVRYIRVQITYP
jgi:hypothetical protein